MKGDVTLVPVVLESTDPEVLAKMVVAERMKKGQIAAVAHYTSVYVQRNGNGGQGNNGYCKHFAFVEFMVEEK